MKKCTSYNHYYDSNQNSIESQNHKSQENKYHLSREISNKSELSIFHSVKHLGFIGWKSSTLSSQRKNNAHLSSISTKEEIISKIIFNYVLDGVKSVKQLNQNCPIRFCHFSKPRCYWNQYPYSIPSIAPFYVANNIVEKNSLDDIDFMISGGSVLAIFASKIISPQDKLLIQLIPSSSDTYSKVLFISKYPIYQQNLTEEGFQLESLVTGGSFQNVTHSNIVKNQHMQIIHFHEYKIFISAECDGILRDEIVEIKSSYRPIQASLRIMFQMISNGSTLLYSAEKKGNILMKVNVTSLEHVKKHCFNIHDKATIERNIAYCLRELKKVKTQCLQEIYFVNGRLLLRRYHGSNYIFFPSHDVVDQMLA